MEGVEVARVFEAEDSAAGRGEGEQDDTLSRRRLLGRLGGLTGAGALGAVAGSAIRMPGGLDGQAEAAGQATSTASPPTGATPVAATPEIQTFLDTAVTLEALSTTYVGVVRNRASPTVLLLNLGGNPAAVRYLRAAQCAEEAHYYYLRSLGGRPVTETFSFPDELFQSRTTALRSLLELENLEMGLYLTAARELAMAGEATLVEIVSQIALVEGGHHALLKELLDEFPPHNRAFAPSLFPSVAAAADALAATGFLEGAGPHYAFPGPEPRYCRGMSGFVPETTEEILARQGVGAGTAPAATPQAEGG